MSISGTAQARKLIVQYCKRDGSSRFARDWVKEHLPSFGKEYPAAEIESTVRSGHHPVLRVEYVSGKVKTVGIKNEPAESISRYAKMLMDQSGNKYKKWGNGYQQKNTISVQGGWKPTPFN